jgi:hypothetical protein
MKLRLIVALTVITSALFLNAQDMADPSSVTTANSQITEVRLDGFEDASFWKVAMPIDQGVISRVSRFGKPLELDTDEWNERDDRYGIPTNYAKERVLGIKVEYISRGYNWFTVAPVKPIVIEGITQSISVWVAGRNYSHWLKMVVQDFYGNDRLLFVERLRFIGWKEVKVSVPETVAQRDFHFVDKIGIKFKGFIIECDPVETFGVYYMYFDELRAVTDVFNEKTRDLDDMVDDW